MRKVLAVSVAAAVLGAGGFIAVSRFTKDRDLTLRIRRASLGLGSLPAAIPASPESLSPHDSPIRKENDRPGSRAWMIDARVRHDIEGFAGTTSVRAGSPITFFVRTTAPTFDALVFRMGWYRGNGGRLIRRLSDLSGDGQPNCPLTPEVFTISCASWHPSFTLKTSRAWVTGSYLVKLVSSDGGASFVPFVVREAVPRAPILTVSSVTTWQAYNLWGERSLYRDAALTGHPGFANRSRIASFDRPYAWPGDGQFLRWDYPLVWWMESRGFDVAYATDVDLHEGNDAIVGRRALISAGHDEYWSLAMRRNVARLIRTGVSVGFFGGNDMFRHIRFAPSQLGPDRLEVDYRVGREDPLSTSDPADVTVSWRDPPNDNPEQTVMGEQFGPCHPRVHDWYPTMRPSWLFEGTQFRLGDHVTGILGYEIDWIWPGLPRPAREVVVSASPVRCAASRVAESSLYEARSGAYVFDAGSIWFDCGLGPGCGDFPVSLDSHLPPDPKVAPDPRLQRLVKNLLAAMIGPHPTPARRRSSVGRSKAPV